MTSEPPAGTQFARVVNRLVDRVSHWTPSRWAASSPSLGGGTRADVLHRLIQQVADLGADAEGRPRRPVPRLDSDLTLPDQLRVVAADLLAAPDPALDTATDLVHTARRAL